MKLAKRLQPEEASHKLNEVAERLDIPPFAHHNAGDDAMASALIVLGLADQHGFRSLAELWPTKASAARGCPHSLAPMASPGPGLSNRHDPA